jgi:hypothetical protein
VDRWTHHDGGMVEWWNGGMVEWWNGGIDGYVFDFLLRSILISFSVPISSQ